MGIFLKCIKRVTVFQDHIFIKSVKVINRVNSRGLPVRCTMLYRVAVMLVAPSQVIECKNKAFSTF
ncbi:hypothetical protein D9M68_746880 [compost metagenome]